MRGQYGYAAISVMLGIAAACYDFHILTILVVLLYLLYCLRCPGMVSFLCIGMLFASAFYAFQVNQHNRSGFTGAETSFTGVISSSPVLDGDKLSFQFQTKETLQVSYRIPDLKSKQGLRSLRPGMRCNLQGTLQLPSPARNFYAFDYKQYLFYHHIHYLLIPDEVSLKDCQNINSSILSSLYNVRQSAIQHVSSAFPEETIGFMNALIFGERNQITEQVELQYQALGLIHLLAISGSHISLLAAVCYYILLRMGITRETATVILLFILPIYMILAGASPSVVRACVTAFIVLCGFLFSSKIIAIDAMSIACILMLMYNPYFLFDIGFQLSFLVSFSLILSSETILLKEENAWRMMWKVTVIAQLIALPVTLYHFHQFSPYSFLLNMIYVPFISFLILPLCLFAFFFSFVLPVLAQLLGKILSFLIVYSNKLLDASAQLPFSNLTFGKPPIWVAFLYFILVICLFVSWEGKVFRKYAQTIFGMFLLALCLHYYVYLWNPYGKITFLDVGQGDSILIQLPFGKGTYLIDTGGTVSFSREKWQQRKREYSVGTDVVLPYLKAEGVKTIDKLILTHGDMDHVGEAKAILEQMPVKEVVLGKKEGYSELEEEIVKVAAQEEVKIEIIQSGQQWKAGEAIFTIVSPFGNELEGNDSSIAIHANIGGLTWLFTGDLEEQGEQAVLSRYPNLQADVLKVGHHGSKSSTTEELLQVVQPRIAVISAGERNPYGHPHKEVIVRLKSRNIIILRTDQSGAIAYTFREKTGTFQRKITYDGSR